MSSADMEEDDFAAAGFAERLEAALGHQEKGVIARRARIAPSTFTKYLSGGAEPGAFKAARLAESLGVNLTWLLTGKGKPNAMAGGYFEVPHYDVKLAAGVAKFADAAKVVGMVPMDPDMLRQLGRTTAEGLGWVESDGDSMHPTIPDGSRVLLDLHDTRLREGVFGFRMENDLRVKRLLRRGEGIDVLSDNPRYSPEHLEGPQLEHFQIIGRAKIGVTFL